MAYSQTDIDAMKAAMALGVAEVRYADGRLTRFRSLTEMQAQLDNMLAEVSGKQRTLADDRVVSGYVGMGYECGWR